MSVKEILIAASLLKTVQKVNKTDMTVQIPHKCWLTKTDLLQLVQNNSSAESVSDFIQVETSCIRQVHAE